MSALSMIVDEMIKNLPKDAFTDRTGGLKDVRRVIDIMEKALQAHAEETAAAGQARLRKSVADPFHDFVKNPVFAPMGAERWRAMDTFPRITRNAMLIAVYSHVEYLLLSWCETVSPQVERRFDAFPRGKNESYPHHYVRYLRDGAGLALGDFTKWPEWAPLNGYRTARNCLAHNGGIIRDKERASVGSLPCVQIDDTKLAAHASVVHLLPGACEAMADTMIAFLERSLTAAGL